MFSCPFLLIIIKRLDCDISLDIYRVVVLITMGPGILKLSSNTNISHAHTQTDRRTVPNHRVLKITSLPKHMFIIFCQSVKIVFKYEFLRNGVESSYFSACISCK